jgi:hypothetical protein
MFNRILKSILQNSKPNREKFVKSKKLYIETTVKNRSQNYNKIITRKMTTFSKPGFSFYGGGGNGGGGGPKLPKGIIYMFIAAVSCNISSKLVKRANSKEE